MIPHQLLLVPKIFKLLGVVRIRHVAIVKTNLISIWGPAERLLISIPVSYPPLFKN